MLSLEKLGQVKLRQAPEGTYEAMLPIITRGLSSKQEVLFGRRDISGRSHIFRSEIKPDGNNWLIEEIGTEVLANGSPGTFDSDGVSPGSISDIPKLGTLLYYTGWSRTQSVPYNNSIGVALWNGDQFVRLFQGPLLTRSTTEPFNCASPFVMKDSNGLFRMWYAGTINWEGSGGLAKPRYQIMYAESEDGIAWNRSGVVSLPLIGPSESAIGRPFVEKINGRYEMWFAVRGRGYVIGHAVSTDGVVFQRTALFPNLLGAIGEWDGEMTEYPWLVRHEGKSFMFYNGNGFGRTGIGVARIEPKSHS